MPAVPLDQRLRTATAPAIALLPVRFFFAATFLYAGFDKLLDAGFFDPSSPASLHAQMVGFARTSPLGGLVRFAEPGAVVIGLLIAVADVGIGLGALTGLAFRVAAVGGAVLSMLLYLTVSWTTHPYYLGSDLPYAVGWLALAIAGHGGLLVPRRLTSRADETARRAYGRRRDSQGASAERRALLQTGVLAVAAVAVSSVALPLRLLGFVHAAPPPTSLTGAGSPSGVAVAHVAEVERSGSATFTIPFDAKAPLRAGDPAIVVRVADGTYVAFDAVCPHAGCAVEWSVGKSRLVCPCHDAEFDPENDGAVTVGPAEQPLSSLPVSIDPTTGAILLQT